jgi:SOS-response transcriptional repressor LexA
MSGEELKRLRAAMADNRPPIPFVGAGFSSAVTGGEPCATWRGLLLDGIDVCADKAPGLPEGWADHRKLMLNEGTADSYILAADEIRKHLGPVRDGWEFRSWLEGTVGSLQPKGEGENLIAAVRALGKIVVTTNYDTLIEQAEPKWTSSTWTDSGYEIADLTEESVLHLHGVFANPDSVILGGADYQQLNDAELQDTLSKSLFARYRFIFIGCGSGLADPHIGPLIKFIERVVPKQGPENFILIKNGEIRQYNDRPLSQKITPVGYGDGYEKLLPFLRSLAPKQDAVPGAAPSPAKQHPAANQETGPLAQAKLAEQKLRDAQSALGRVSDAMEDVQRKLPAPAMNDWTFEKQEAEHGQRAGALSGSAQQLEICSKEALGEFRAVEDEVSQLIEPRFVGFASRLGRITKDTTDLESDAARLLNRAAEARDEVGGRIAEYDGYRAIYATLSRAHAAIEQARSTATRSLAALTGLVSGSEPRREDQARRTARSAEPAAPSRQQRDAAQSEIWRVPIVGSAAAGTANLSAESEDAFVRIPQPRNTLKENVLAVRVDGDSMTGDDMLNGDYVIIDKARQEPRQGEIAVVRIGPSVYAEMAVKHVWREEDGLLLKPSDTETHDSRKVLWNEEPYIEGVVIGVHRPASYRSVSD